MAKPSDEQRESRAPRGAAFLRVVYGAGLVALGACLGIVIGSLSETPRLVHGCFWHRHPRCRFAYTPKSNLQFWLDKFASNVRRDKSARAELKKAGWRVLVVWECEVNDQSLKKLIRTIKGAAR